MSAVSYTSVRRALAGGDLALVYYLTGDEDVLKDELVGAVIDAALDPASRDFNLDVRWAGDLSGESLYALIETPPMLAERRVAIVRGLEQWRKNSTPWAVLQAYLARPSPTTVLVLVAGAGHAPDTNLQSAATHVAVTTPDPDTVRDWAVRRAAAAGVTLTTEGAAHLIGAVGGSLSYASAEIDKLTAAHEADAEIGVSEVERFVGVRHGETLLDWVDAVARRDVKTAVRLLDIVLPQPGITAVKMLNSLGTTLVGTRLTRAFADQRKSVRQVKDDLWTYLKRARPKGIGRYSEEIDRWIAAAKRWRTNELDRALRLMYAADEQLKSTTISDPRGTLTSMLLRFGSAREAA